MYCIIAKILLILVLNFTNFRIFTVNCDNVSIPNVGKFIGKILQNNVKGFLGVKYASVKNRRFQFAEPLPLSDDLVYDATEYGQPCPKSRNVLAEPLNENDEDCLFLNIYTTTLSPSAKQPVLFYIHGEEFHDNVIPVQFLQEDIVFITVQYRLGPLGFLSTETQDIPGNAGFVDVVFALEWLSSYVVHFGGDPNRLTVFGHGSGAAIASALMYWNRPAIWSDRFHRVILLSGSYFSPRSFDFNPVTKAKDLALFIGCPQASLISIEDVNKCLKECSLDDLLKAYERQLQKSKLTGNNVASRFTVNEQLPSPYLVIKSGQSGLKSVLAGVTKHNGITYLADALNFINNNNNISCQTFKSYSLINSVIKFLGLEEYTGTLLGFSASTLFSQEILENEMFEKLLPGLIDISSGTAIKAAILKDIQFSVSQRNPTYLYTFDYHGDSSLSNSLNGSIYEHFKTFVAHGDDLRLIFPAANNNLSEKSKRISKLLVDLLISFTITGIPKAGDVHQFPRFTSPYLHINEKTETGENFLDEFSVATRDANGCRIGENISCSVMILMHCLIIIISLVNSILL